MTGTAIGTTANIRPIPLGTATLGGGVACRVSGWGQTSHPGSAPVALQWVDKTTITNAACANVHGSARIQAGTLCTSSPAGRGTCMGDSGGPLVTGTGTGQVLVGIVSWGTPCATTNPDAYARVSQFASWISNAAQG